MLLVVGCLGKDAQASFKTILVVVGLADFGVLYRRVLRVGRRNATRWSSVGSRSGWWVVTPGSRRLGPRMERPKALEPRTAEKQRKMQTPPKIREREFSNSPISF